MGSGFLSLGLEGGAKLFEGLEALAHRVRDVLFSTSCQHRGRRAPLVDCRHEIRERHPTEVKLLASTIELAQGERRRPGFRVHDRDVSHVGLGHPKHQIRTISEAAEELDVPQHVLRFWETRFSQIRPMKRGGGRRYYRPEDMDLLRTIRSLLYGEGYTIRGVQRLLKERGVRAVLALNSVSDPVAPSHGLPPISVPSDGDEDDSVAADVFADMSRALRAALDDIEDAQRILRSAHAR